MKKNILIVVFALLGIATTTNAQSNIFSGERVQVVGTFNGFVTSPYGTDYRTTTFRKLSIPTGTTPTDGRGQWVTTINVQAAGGDVIPINMLGGGGGGFLFISGPTNNAFQNKWAFTTIGQAAIDGVNFTTYNSGDDMGLNMTTPGFYTFVLNDCGYSGTDAKYYIGLTSAAPVNVNRTLQTINGNNSATINIATTAAPSMQEKVYVRYTTSGNFAGTGSSSVVQATGSGTSFTATIPTFPAGTVVTYYVFTSTKMLAALNSASEIDKSLQELKFDDNAGSNYTYTLTAPIPVRLLSFAAAAKNNEVNVKWVVAEEDDVNTYEVLKSTNSSDFKSIGKIDSRNSLAPEEVYNFTDNNPSAGTSYYQLLTNKITGEKKYSDISTVSIKSIEKGITVLTNQFSSVITLKMKNISVGDYNLNIINSLGQIVFSKKINRTDVYADENLALKNKLQRGVYTISLSNKEAKFVQSFFVN